MPLDTKQPDLPLGLNPSACFADIAARSVHLGSPVPELGKLYAAELQARCSQPPPFQFFGKPFAQSDLRSWCAATATTTPHGASESSQKRLLIFDQTGNQTRLLRCPFPLRFPTPTAAEPMKLSELHGLEKAFKEDCEEFNENQNESEMHEDTEEINALLYSDDEYDDDGCESDDEVMSTGHSPYPTEQICNKRGMEEIDGPCKRQKLVDKVYSSSSLVGTESSTKLKDKSLPESNISTKEDTGSGLSDEQSKKDKIRTALKILESVVPGAKGNEALSLLDEAIDYLKLLKRNLISTSSSSHKSPILFVKETTWGTRNLQSDKS